MFSKNKEKIKKGEETLTLLEDQYIELTTKTGMDLLIGFFFNLVELKHLTH